jgi:NTE family protein
MPRLFIFSLLFYISGLTLIAQDSPKIGLVLSGGGAKGMAHIGVLKVLEEVGIVPDYITGTSMGAVVGGLYAIGYSAAQLEEIALTADWDVLLANKTHLSNIAIEHKEYYGRYQLNLPIEGISIGLPKGLIEGQELSEFFTRLTTSVHEINDFDNLPIPFRCIGADIATGDAIVIKSGFLATAMRASMAIPSIFTPIEIDGRLLVDGGLVHNFPVQDVIDMGADIVIGISVGDSLLNADELTSMVEILSQATFIASYKETQQQMKLTDYYINPVVKPYSTGSFDAGDSLILRGEQAARMQYDALKSLADSLKQLRTFEPVKLSQIDTSFKISSVRVRGNEAFSDQLIIGKLDIQLDSALTQSKLTSRISAIYGMLNFDRVTYEIQHGPQGNTLIVDVKESTPGTAAFNLHYDSENGVGLMVNLTFRNLGLNNTRLTLEGDIAETSYFHGNYFLYVGKNQNLAISAGARYFADDIPAFDFSGNKEIIYKSRLTHFYINVQSTKHQNKTYGLQFFSDLNKLKPIVADSSTRLFKRLTYTNFGVRPYYNLNNLNRKSLPTHGKRISVSGTINLYMNGNLSEPMTEFPDIDPDYTLVSLDVEYEQYFPIFTKITAFTLHTFRLTNLENGKSNISGYYFTGGFKPNFIQAGEFWGADKYEYQLTSFYRGVGGIRYEMFNDFYLIGALNFLETKYPMDWLGNDFFDIAQAAGKDRRLGWYLNATLNTIVGPLTFGIANDFNRKKIHTYLSLGFNFKNSRQF